MSPPDFKLTPPPSEWFGSAEYGWDEETGRPGIGIFGNALQVWSICQRKASVTVAEAAAAFKVTEQVIRDAVENHYWMFLEAIDADGPDSAENTCIRHEGE